MAVAAAADGYKTSRAANIRPLTNSRKGELTLKSRCQQETLEGKQLKRLFTTILDRKKS